MTGTVTPEVDSDAATRGGRGARWRDLIGLLARLVLGGSLLYAGLLKMGKPLTAQRAVQAYDIFPMELAGWIGLALPWIQIVLGALLVLGLFTRISAIIGTLMMLAFIAGVAQAWARGLTIDCGCFSSGGQVAAGETVYPQTIARDIGFAAAGAWLCWRPRSLASLDRRLFGDA